MLKEVFGDCLLSSVDVSRVLPKDVYRHTRLRDKMGEGWFSYVAMFSADHLAAWCGDLSNVMMGYKGWPSRAFFFTTIIVKCDTELAKENSDYADDFLRCHTFKYYAAQPRLISPHRETVDSYIIVWFDDMLDAASIKQLMELYTALRTLHS